RQQRAYGRSEALVESRHPERFTGLGTARWLGCVYPPSGARAGRRRIFRGPFGASQFQSGYRAPSHGADIAHPLRLPVGVAVALALCAPAAALWSVAAAMPIAGGALLAALLLMNVARARPPAGPRQSRLGARAVIAVLTMGQPLARAWGRAHRRQPAAGAALG